MSDTFKVHKIYPCIQGEGKNAGVVRLIIDLFSENEFTEYTIEELSEVINDNKKHVLWTGGEPSLQEKLIYECRTIVPYNIDFDIETNGSKLLEYPQIYTQITVSPKQNIPDVCSMYWRIYSRYANVIFKFVVDNPEEVRRWIDNTPIDPTITYAQRQSTTYNHDLELSFIKSCISNNINYSPRLQYLYDLE
jgi:organic radical activating enzyme